VFEVACGDPTNILAFIARTPDSDWFHRVWPPRLEAVAYPTAKVLVAADIRGMRVAFRAKTPNGTFVRHAAGGDFGSISYSEPS
jgi:hypothetical protein